MIENIIIYTSCIYYWLHSYGVFWDVTLKGHQDNQSYDIINQITGIINIIPCTSDNDGGDDDDLT